MTTEYVNDKEYTEVVRSLDANTKEGEAYQSEYNAKWDHNYRRLKHRMWELYNRSDERPKLDFGSAMLALQKEQSIFDQGRYTVNAIPLRKDKATAVLAILISTFSEQRWTQHDMAYKTLCGFMHQAYTGVHLIKSGWNPVKKEFESTLVRPEGVLVSDGAADFDDSRFVVHRITKTIQDLRIEYGKYIAERAPHVEAAISRGNGVRSGSGFGIGELPDGKGVDFYYDGGPASDTKRVYLDEHLVYDSGKIHKYLKVGDCIIVDQMVLIDEFWWTRFPAMAIDEFWPLASTEILGSISDAESMSVSYMMDYIRESTYMKYIVDTNSGLKINDLNNQPGGIWWTDGDPNTMVRSIAPPAISAQAFAFPNMLDEKMQKASFPDEQFGRLQQRGPAAQTQMLLSAGQSPVTLKASLMGRSAGKWAMLHWKMEVAMSTKIDMKDSPNPKAPSERLTSLTGAVVKSGSIDPVQMNKDANETEQNITALKVAIEADPQIRIGFDFVSGLTATKDQKKQESMALYQGKAIDDEALLTDFERTDKDEILGRKAKAIEAQAQLMAAQKGGAPSLPGPGAPMPGGPPPG